MHIGLTATAFDESVAFYTKLFGQEPTLARADYAKWMLDDPFINLSIVRSHDGGPGVGVDHLGFQVESSGELEAARAAIDEAGLPRSDQDELVCGYQRQDKSWVFDPHGLPIETFVTHEVVDDYGTNDMPEPS